MRGIRDSGLRCAGLALALALTLSCLGQGPGTPDPPAPDAARIGRWIAGLADPDLEARARARESLLAADAAAVPALRKALQSADPEIAESARRILERIDSLPCQIARAGARGIRADLLGERWFVIRKDAQGAGAVYVEVREEKGPCYRFRIVFADTRDTLHVSIRGKLSPDFTLAEVSVEGRGPNGKPAARSFAPPRRGPCDPVPLMVLAWFFPFSELTGEAPSVTVLPELLDPEKTQDLAVHRGAAQEIPAPLDARRQMLRAEPIRFSEKDGAAVLTLWLAGEGKLVRLVWGAGEYDPASREEAVQAVEGGKKGEWWKD